MESIFLRPAVLPREARARAGTGRGGHEAGGLQALRCGGRIGEVFSFICCSVSVFLFTFISFLFSVDMWSVGCIMGEMIKGAVLFPGTDRILPSSRFGLSRYL